MKETFPLFPNAASTVAGRVDALYFYLITVSVVFTLLIALSILYFAIKYRRRSESELPRGVEGSLKLEIAWSVIPLVIALSFFFWGASVFFAINRPPPDALEVSVVGKQWMWKVQHADGQREINELHVPVGRPVRLTMTSEDTIHSFYVPAFRIKRDVLPGRVSTMWFQATRTGRFHLFCAEYCGTKHSGMIGWIDVMDPVEFQAWLSGGSGSESLASAGSKLFAQHACNTCHRSDSLARGPNLEGVFGKTVALQDGRTVTADETYIRESIVMPNAKIVAGFQPIMPTFQGLISEEGLLQLVAYVKSLSKAAPSPGGVVPPVTQPSPGSGVAK
ncbi:MAG TPA: cytochrome c oxidase subunit II [Thermoanaerobaculia bacterium]|nr:cytochrome c oxidase subunit II [Thermoanaerobaculia bacterium]